MTLENLHAAWSIEGDIDFSQPDLMLRQIPLLHHKWWQRYTDERLRYVALKQDHDKLKHQRFEWYTGRLDEDARKALGWEPQPLRLVRGEVDNYLAADALLLPKAALLEAAELKLKFIEDVIKQVGQRSFLMKNWIDWQKFSQGS